MTELKFDKTKKTLYEGLGVSEERYIELSEWLYNEMKKQANEPVMDFLVIIEQAYNELALNEVLALMLLVGTISFISNVANLPIVDGMDLPPAGNC